MGPGEKEVMRLFIIGNGFDVAHQLPTSYDNFRKYLESTYRLDLYNMPYIPESMIGEDGECVWNDSQVATLLVYLISKAEGSKWSDVETTIGELDYIECFKLLPQSQDLDSWIDINEQLSESLWEIIPTIKRFFDDWVKTIKIDGVSRINAFNSLINDNSVYLNFNYTETLEKVYGIKNDNVCHIHGKCDDDILFGHGNSRDFAVEYAKYNGCQNALEFLEYSLRKDTDGALYEHQAFFEKLNDITDIYVIGFSFGDVDETYIEEICNRITKDTIWYFNEYSRGEVPKFLRKLRKYIPYTIKYEIERMT